MTGKKRWMHSESGQARVPGGFNVARVPVSIVILAVFLALQMAFLPLRTAAAQEFRAEMFDRPNLVAWCIVPFDSEKRTPLERAQMLEELQIRRLAYDYRAEHIPTFEEEILTLKKHGIELTAWWFPTVLNDEAKLILSLVKKHQVHPQLWVTGGGDPAMNEKDEAAFMESEVRRIREIALAAQDAGCQVALYNHGGWFGIPENQMRLIEAIDLPNVGIVYNLHHAHDQIDRLPEILERIGPKLLALNLNGMQTDGERLGKKILVIGEGDRDRELLRIIGQSGFRGPIGILNHTDLDARQRLIDNMNGLDRLVQELGSTR
ncbi:MAG: sugar phosphate isomerase/epimerase [Pirellula sp.]|nr:sugar phosphate isomerase/epimerase [Pirellula sp.]